MDLDELPRPPLPEPQRQRWQPLRLGLVDLFHYDSEEFQFHDGRLLLRGNNGTGKSKVLSLTLPLLLDANLRASRVEPDGDTSKKMAWNLLVGSYPRRIGYSWIEFGRIAEDGRPRYLTLGAGMSAVAARAQVESWFFVLEADAPQSPGPRIGQDLWLTTDKQVVLTRERLREAIEGRGQIFPTAESYRRGVDERLFQLGAQRYDALMDTLIQLRQPQLSRKPDEAGLSRALSEALPPLPQELLADVAEALNQLEEDRRQLDEFRQLAQAVDRFDSRYRLYAGTLSRRQARALRQAQTDFDRASQERHQRQEALARQQSDEVQARDLHDQAKIRLGGQRARYDTLLLDPANQAAGQLEQAQKDAEQRADAARSAQAQQSQAEQGLQRELRASSAATQRAVQAEQALLQRRGACAAEAQAAGLGASFEAGALAQLAPEGLAELPARDFDRAPLALQEAVKRRREQIQMLERRHAALLQARAQLAQRQENQRAGLADHDEALERRGEADLAAEQAADHLLEAWTAHAGQLEQLRLDDLGGTLEALAAWLRQPDEDNPALRALQAAQQQASTRHAARQAGLDNEAAALAEEQEALMREQAALQRGRDAEPPLPHTRHPEARRGRPGAPLWQLLDFQPQLTPPQRAGLEAALEGAGLLDAWVLPDGQLLGAGSATLDSRWTERPPAQGLTLAHWLRADAPAASGVSAAVLERLLASVSCAPDDADDGSAEAWLAPDGRYRLAGLAGSWHKPQAVYIGHAARAEARRQRLVQIGTRLDEIAQLRTALTGQQAQLAADRDRAALEWRQAPSEQPLRQALLTASARAREAQAARQKLDRLEALCREAEQAALAALRLLEDDAADMALPAAAEALPAVSRALQDYSDALHHLLHAALAWRHAQPERQAQQAREAEARERLQADAQALLARQLEAEAAQTRYEVLNAAIGAAVSTLRQQLTQARHAVVAAEAADKAAAEASREAGMALERCRASAATAELELARVAEARALAVSTLQRFAATSLLASALPALELPDPRQPWTIDPALNLARRVEQALQHISDDDAHWARVQKQITEDLQDLQRALSALGHQAPAEASDWGFVVHIIFHNRPERPDQLAARLADDIAQRSELLTAHERAVLENHLQAEIAAQIQRLMRAAERQVDAINTELHKRPTSTGVRYRLQWQALSEADGAPVGLEAARQRLLHTGADLWSAEDRRVVGAMLQQRIVAERERADSDLGGGSGNGNGSGNSSLIDQLARALDYRRWHEFRVQRYQQGQWRRLSGPASSGERALGLTVPLFAAIASFYSQGSMPLAPRLMLLDEAFAGIDKDARAHCMGLIREFDLDFVITSESEWACYAELPGVAICHLQRREGVDAVHVSRWVWDGSARRREDDPGRRFPLAQ